MYTGDYNILSVYVCMYVSRRRHMSTAVSYYKDSSLTSWKSCLLFLALVESIREVIDPDNELICL